MVTGSYTQKRSTAQSVAHKLLSKLGMQTNNTHNTQVTNPGTPQAKQGNRTYTSSVAVVTNTGANWATMVKVGNRAYQVVAITSNAQGNTTAYTVVTRAGLMATLPASACPHGAYTGYCGTVQYWHWGVCKLAVAMGMVAGLNRYAQ